MASFRSAFDNEATADLRIIVGDKSIYAHAVSIVQLVSLADVCIQGVLRIRSEFFQRALSDRWLREPAQPGVANRSPDVNEESQAQQPRIAHTTNKENMYK